MIHVYLVIVLQLFSSIFTLDSSVRRIEENLIKSSNQIDRIYRELIQSNDVEQQCFPTTVELFQSLKIEPNENFTRNEIQRLLPALINVKVHSECNESAGRGTWKNILIGFLAVTFINCSALGGAVIYPFRKKPIFKWILCVFIGLAAGTLTGSGIFHLIPMAFNIPHLDVYHNYLNKALITMIVIYLFYIRDQLLKIFFHVNPIVPTHNHGVEDLPVVVAQARLAGFLHNLRRMKAAGWMIFLGDMLHNFIDGLTLGAAYMVSIGEGLRMTLPIVCEEFPHELGDIAVLLSCGLTIGQALIVNFLAACSCYAGFFIGAKLGQLEEFHPWIYALAGGMFVYIGLTDMIPELVAMGHEVEKDYKGKITCWVKLKIFLGQNSGILLGISIMYILGRYGKYLENLVQF